MNYTTNEIARRTLALVAVISAVMSGNASAQLPEVTGTIYYDANLDGAMSGGEQLSGVTVQLFQDDGDNIFNPDVDAIITSSVTNSDGVYSFGGLDVDANYFVFQSAQAVGGMVVDQAVTDLLNNSTMNLLIDDFADQQRVEGNPVQVTNATNLTSTGVIGGQRDLHVEYLSGPAEAVLYANPFGMSEVLEFNQSANVQAVATVTWDGIDGDMTTTPNAGGLGGLDLTVNGSEAFVFDLGIDAAGAGDSLTFRIFTGTEVSTATIEFPQTNGTATVTQVVPFADFIGGADFESVDAIQLELGGDSPSIDAQLGAIGVIGPAVANIAVSIPEPSSALMMTFAAVWLVGARRKKRRVR